ISLDGEWKLRVLGENIFHIPEEYVSAAVPGTVYTTYVENGMMPDPFYRENELEAMKLSNNDFEYLKEFTIEEEQLLFDRLLLVFEGIDTLADIYLNGKHLDSTCNMHCRYEYDVLNLVKAGENELRVVLHSPVKYIQEENEKVYTGGSWDAMEGYPHLRKAHCMFGWDWGPRLPDAGIFRPVYLLGIRKARIRNVYVRQQHEMDRVVLSFDTDIEVQQEKDSAACVKQVITVMTPEGNVLTSGQDGTVIVDKPQLWWPNGYGKQPLYTVRLEVLDDGAKVLDVWERRIGLRTMTVNTEPDEWGRKFAHRVNGLDIFAMGADYIPEDSLFGRINRERTERLLKDCVAANYNCIRVWGGGYYPDDYFYDICDELGLLVWQDFMFACSSYELDDAFDANIREEITQNVRRLRHHASLALWCGNNEMETQTLDGCWKPSPKQKCDYNKIFEYIIPGIVKAEDPQAFYWPSSPSSGGSYDNPWDENRGDTHYWDVWHGCKPFTAYRNYRFRYLSEFGFQSFPCLKTVESFTEPEDRNIFSRVMEMHQRNRAANGKILDYLSQTYLYPKDFDSLLYTSQLLQAEAIKYGVEHFRRYRGQCMGAVVWQLNDIWPVASWASID
ncbi:MAG: glycoside hydrolase family 2 protein, partial [Lachnospiraceae bacterium]